MFVEELATVMGPLVGVRDHRRLGQMHAHVVLPLTTNPTHQETVLTLALPGTRDWRIGAPKSRVLTEGGVNQPFTEDLCTTSSATRHF
jgi:hypothetical protein